MSRGIYTLASGLLATENSIAKATENLVNVNTNGYKSSVEENKKFEPYMLLKKQGKNTKSLSKCSDGIYSSNIRTDYSQGTVYETGRKLDVAIYGRGFFALESESENMLLTREGSFLIDEEGYLATANGKRVLGEDGPIMLQADKFNLDKSGVITSESGEELARLAVYYTSDDDLQRTDNNCFIATRAEKQNLPSQETELIQGSLEESNVERLDEMIKTVESSKLHAIYSKSIKMYDELEGKINTQILGN